MKKSKAIRLVLLGGTSLALAGCDDGPPSDAKFFSSLQECTAHYSEAQCKDAVKESEAQHATQAPRFSRKEECEAQFGPGHCETHEGAGGMGGFFMPMMMGYMMGNMMGGMFRGPVYSDRAGTAFTTTPGGKTYNVGAFSGAAGAATAGSTAFKPMQIAQVNRGGFGSSASAFRSSAGS